ncbi:histidine kinase [Massilia sp. KIM]|uniref:oxygenase MpaB family protein n=1 Tax=Massilia sp. KIM TaxID=1955422 RepID=UPI00098F9A84|nr:oxygenase MpaB family protein [Massilia sp. KIM]OON60930.1 histidine kinase [Massilia sp. KIM]
MLKSLTELLQPPAGMAFDFGQPAGEPALAPAQGVTWRIFANPVTLFVGGGAAVLLELAEPSVCAGVWDRGGFKRDPALRLRRTGFAAMVTVYGARSAAERMIARVVRVHEGVQGLTAAGLPYRANDPRLLDWVHSTASFGFAQAYDRYAWPLTAAEKDRVFAEGLASAALYGASGAPGSWGEWEAMLAAAAPRLEGSDVLTEFLDIMARAPILPGTARGLQALLVRAGVEIVPEPVRSLPQLRGRGLRRGEALLARSLALASTRLPLGDTPARQAARRVAAVPKS